MSDNFPSRADYKEPGSIEMDVHELVISPRGGDSMASFAHLAYVLERAADIMLGDHQLDPDQALKRAVWGETPDLTYDSPELEAYYIAARVIEMQYCQTTGADLASTHVRRIPQMAGRNVARHMAELFHRIDFSGQSHVEENDIDVIPDVMWEQAHGVEMARCP
ncbi:hypothetical protein AB0392_37840 [Nonomuraea angiospora]|uniref:hypothetical protein n=1 Tax=Nonomuraea angiospora TaxID=46172 RepID=UPI00344FA470